MAGKGRHFLLVLAGQIYKNMENSDNIFPWEAIES